MTKTITNIDKLQLSFKNSDIKLMPKKDFSIEYILKTDKLFNRDFLDTIKLYYKHEHFLTIYHKHKSCSTHSLIAILNERLYTDDYNTILKLFLDTYSITNWQYSKLEICINTNEVITSKYLKLFKKGKINFIDDYTNYNSKDYGETIEHITKDFSKRTFYIYNKKKHLRVKELRIEDKTNEIENNSYKYYILDYYKNRGLNTNKSIYRIELTLDFAKLKSIIYKREYREVKSYNILTSRQFKKLNIDQRLNYFTMNYIRDYQKSINLNSLVDELFLIKLFNSFVMINYDIIVKPATAEMLSFELKLKDIITPDRKVNNISYDDIKNDILTFDNLFNN